MTIIREFNNLLKKILNFGALIRVSRVKILDLNKFLIICFVGLLTIIFLTMISLNTKNQLKNQENLKKISKTNDFTNLVNFFTSKINSPYENVKYTIKNNDSVEKILKKYNISNQEINDISIKLKQKKLTNIYSGRELNLIFKKSEEKFNNVVNLLFPISNTKSVEVRKIKDQFIVKENILQLYKKEVVVKSLITRNLYSSAVKEGIEPNIIVEFARIFGFEVDFQRDIRKGDWFEIFYEKFEDENQKEKDTGKII